MNQRRLLQAQCGLGRMHPVLQRRGRIGAVEDVHTPWQRRLAPDHLHGHAQVLPDHAGAQDVVAGDDLVERIEEGDALLGCREGQQRGLQVRIGEGIGQVMEQQAFLQRRQRIEVLHVGRAAVDIGHHRVDLGLGQFQQRQQVGRDATTVGLDAVGRDDHLGGAVQAIGQPGDGGRAEQGADFQLPAKPAQALDQLDRQ